MIPAFTQRLISLAIRNIWRRRLRSSLTILGIVFGVSSVIAMLAIGEGASYEAQEQIKRLGSRNIIINSVKPPRSESVGSETSRMSEYGLTYDDVRRISEVIPDVEVIVPSRTVRADVTHGIKRIDANAIATLPIFPRISNQRVALGRFFSDLELADHKNVCVLTTELARRLFSFGEPLGKTIKVRDDFFVVIGVLEESGPSASSEGEELTSLNLYVPITTAKSRFGDIIVNRSTGSFNIEKIELHRIIVATKETEAVMGTAEVVRGVLAPHHKEEDFEIVVPLELLRQAQRTRRIFNVVLGSIAAISLLVGGIGIMNIMLATVTERTREIGIRRALGAKKSDIITQFLIETVLLSGCGGTIGLILGVSLPFIITGFAGMETIIRLWSLVLAFGISILIGLIFGIYPAYRAAAMNPITALRHE
jgi:putative ABC transport system permease protein